MGSADGSFGEMDWLVTPGVVPATIAAGDVTGDGRPDIVVGTSDGFLQVYFWENLFGAKREVQNIPWPISRHPWPVRLQLPPWKI